MRVLIILVLVAAVCCSQEKVDFSSIGSTQRYKISPTGSIHRQSHERSLEEPNVTWNDRYYHELIHYKYGLAGGYSNDSFGSAIAMNRNGTLLAIGARGISNGTVYVFELDCSVPGCWKDVGLFENTGIGGNGSLDMNADGNMIVIGSPKAYELNGTATVYRREGREWDQVGNELIGSIETGLSGFSVSISGTGLTVAVGAPNIFGDKGRVTIYEWNSTDWIPSGDHGHTIVGSFLGGSVSLNYNGDRIVIGEKLPLGANRPAHVLARGVSVYGLVNRSWIQIGDNISTGNVNSTYIGNDVDISWSGHRIVISGYNVDDVASTVSIYEENDSVWNLVGGVITGTIRTKLEPSVRISGDGNVVGILATKNSTVEYVDKSKLFRYIDYLGIWELVEFSDSVAPKNLFGDAVALDGNGGYFAVGVERSNNYRGVMHVFEPIKAGLREFNPSSVPSLVPSFAPSTPDSSGAGLDLTGRVLVAIIIGIFLLLI